jgi:uncharacterized protein YvpB/uncharacterized coiled-coil protein SlyX
VVIAAITWQRTQQVQALAADVAALQGERQALGGQLAVLEGTANTIERRLTALEANTTAQPPEDWSREMESLQASLAELQATVSSLQAAVDDLTGELGDLKHPSGEEAPESLPTQARLAVARQRQSHSLSCESSAAAMAAQYQGVPLSEVDVLAALPLDDNPHLGFRGNVDGPTGDIEDYGVYAGPIMSILNSQGLPAWPVEDGLKGIKAAIARGNPVLVWVTYNCQPSTPRDVTINGGTVTLVPWQHVVVVVGYSPEGFWANDPYDGQEDFYPAVDFERAMAYFGDMAVEVAAP